METNKLVVVFGVSGCGKTTIAKLLSESIGVPYYDADDFHPEANIAKMANGEALNDNDRAEWLETLSRNLERWEKEDGGILACSALKETYRLKLSERAEFVNWVYLKGDYDLIKQRIEQRSDHYMDARLLRSQFDILEVPEYGIHVDIRNSPEKINKYIKSNLMSNPKSVFGVFGLGVMGKSLALNIADKDFELSVYNRAGAGEEEVVSQFMNDNKEYSKLHGYTDLKAFVDSIQIPRSIFLMIKAGPVVDFVLEDLIPLLSKGDVVIDGGNSHYTDTARRFERADKDGIGFIGAGVSGGEEGARKGPSIMPGGRLVDYEKVAVVLESIAAKDVSGNPCCTYIGPDGAGHFIKMVHNGIEYVEMQLLAELYALLKTEMSNEKMADLFDKWNQGPLSSYLLGITAQILRKKEGSDYLLDKILDKAGNKGTGSWSSKAAMDLGVPNTMMSEAVFARYISSFKEFRKKMSSRVSPKKGNSITIDLKVLEDAYSFARIINHLQGFNLMGEASKTYSWKLDFESISRIWSNGCIIKSALMNKFQPLFRTQGELLDHPEFREFLCEKESCAAELLSYGLNKRVSLQCFGSALNYWIDISTENLPANLIQAQRDFFGAHTYERRDDNSGKHYHTSWK